eukprot:sb/3462132/
MNEADKDYRYMALTDLMTELQKESLSLDPDSEEKICQRLLKLLGDKNSEVQNLAVKCLGPLVGKVKGNKVENIVDVLGGNMLSENEKLRSISTMGLMMVISELHQSSLAAPVSRRICNKLTTALAYPKLENVVASQFEELIKHVMEHLSNPSKYIQSYITCINVICRHAGHRFGEKLKLIEAVFATNAGEDDDLRECSIQVLESCVLWCPGEITEFTPQIVDMCLVYLGYDPNYNYDEGGEEEEEELEEDEDEDDYTDDEDMSWKVRRASAKCLAAIIQARPDLLSDLYEKVSPILISRFKEREQSVRLDVFATYSCLLKQTGTAKQSIVVSEDEMEQITPVTLLTGQVEAIVRGLQKQLYDKHDKSRESCFSLLGDLVTVLPGCLAPYMDTILPAIQKCLSTRGASCYIKISSLGFLSKLIKYHDAAIFTPYIKETVSCVIGSVQDTFYKVISEALLVTEQLVFVIPHTGGAPDSPLVAELCVAIFNATLYRLKEADLDQEIVDMCLVYLGYDPNYNYDEGGEEEEEELEEDEDEDDYTDDEDMSWKVRRASAKCLAAIIQARPDLLSDLYEKVSPILISRFKEREQSVRLDVFATYSCLLKQTGTAKQSIVVSEDEMEQITPVTLLTGQVEAIVKGLQKQLYDKHDKSRESCFSLLGDLVTVLPGCLAPYMDTILPAIHKCLSTRGASCYIKISSLGFLSKLIKYHDAAIFTPYIKETVSCVIGSVQDTFYKVISEALLVTEQLVFVIPHTGGAPDSPLVAELCVAIFNATLYRLKEADLDQEVKERAITCINDYFGLPCTVNNNWYNGCQYCRLV